MFDNLTSVTDEDTKINKDPENQSLIMVDDTGIEPVIPWISSTPKM